MSIARYGLLPEFETVFPPVGNWQIVVFLRKMKYEKSGLLIMYSEKRMERREKNVVLRTAGCYGFLDLPGLSRDA